MASTWPELHSGTNFNYVWDAGLLEWVKETQAGAGGGGGAVTIADGADVAEGSVADAAVVTDAAGTISGKLRGLVKWAFERMPTSLGQKTMANSLPVVLASDQPNLPVTVTGTGTMSTTSDAVTVTLAGHTGVGARVVASGTYAGTIVLEASMDGVNYFTLQFVVIAYGGVVSGMTFVGGLHQGSGTHHISAIFPAGLTHVRIRNSAVSAGSATVTVNATSQLDFTQRFIGAYTQDPGPTQGLQLGGTSTNGGIGQFSLAQVRSTNPGITAHHGLMVIPWGLIDPGGSAGGYPWRLVGGRDPVSNAMRQNDLTASVLAGTGYNGVVVRPYRASDGAGNSEPLKHNSDAAGYVRDGHQALVALSFKVFHEPAANTQATITQASAGAGKRNVCTGITVTLASDGTAPAAVQLYVRLRDGATGAGTVLWSSVISLTAVAGAMVNIERNNIWIEGSQATAMTLEFSAAGGANTVETVSMEGVILTE